MSARPESDGTARAQSPGDPREPRGERASMPSRRSAGSSRSRALALSLLGLAAAGFASACVLNSQGAGWAGIWDVVYQGILLVFPFVALGTLLSLRQPANPIGWLLTLGGLTWLAGGLASTIAVIGLTNGAEPSTVTLVAAFVNDGMWTIGVLFSVALPLLLFPDGRLLSRRWRPVLGLVVLGAVVTFLSWLLSVDPLASIVAPASYLTNPWGIQRLAFLTRPAGVVGVLLFLAMTLAAVVGIAIRFRSATSVERQQIRWVRAGGLLAVASMLVYYVGANLQILPTPVFDVLASVAIAFLPLAYTVAILRYRLYDLDRIVSRTVGYAALTGMLVGTYAVLVTAVSRLTSNDNSWTVALSTLAVAALFQPLRRRVQAVVDRRFNRARYDAARTVEAFRTRLRSQVDIDTVRLHLLTVTRETMQPTTAALWLRPPDRAAS
jgi:hypothetical protein